MKCRYCEEPAVFFRKISNETLCISHFIESIEEKIRKTVHKYRMFTPKEKVVVGLSGGKDSLTLLYNINQIQKFYPISPPVEAILIDEGIKGYRAESCDIAKKMCAEWNVPLHIVPFFDTFGANLDDVIEKLKKINTNPCTVCGTVRRRLLNEKAIELKADKLAIGHNMDDQAETFLQNILRNDLEKIITNPPHGNPVDPYKMFVPRIKPLMAIPESEVMLYCYYKKIPIQTTPCPYVEKFDILRKKVLEFINSMEQHSAEIKFNLLTMNEKLVSSLSKEACEAQLLNEEDLKALSCRICHSPMGLKREICYYCELRKNLDLMK